MIHYANFCDDVNKVFCLYKHLEKYPTVEIPQPGSSSTIGEEKHDHITTTTITDLDEKR